MITVDDIGVFVGIDVGKTEHWAHALSTTGQVSWNKALPNNEAKLRSLYDERGTRGQVLIVVDQPAPSGLLPGLSLETWEYVWLTYRFCRCAALQT